jgi:hypothetical protein
MQTYDRSFAVAALEEVQAALDACPEGASADSTTASGAQSTAAPGTESTTAPGTESTVTVAPTTARRMRRDAHLCDRAGLEQAFQQAQAQVRDYESAKARAETDSASSIASAIAVVAVGLASALY